MAIDSRRDNPRTVFLSACAQVARSIEAKGFRYVNSGPYATYECGPFTFRIAFQSSRYNVAGERIQLWMHAVVHSPDMKALRAPHLVAPFADDVVAGGLVHVLGEEVPLNGWNLAPPSSRSATVGQIVDVARLKVLPFFDQFERPAEVICQLKERSLPMFDLRHAVEFALCFGSRETAQVVLDRFIDEMPELPSAVKAAELTGLELPIRAPNRYAEVVVFLRRAYRLQ